MKKMLSVDDLARDTRFERIRIEDVVFDPRNTTDSRPGLGFDPKDPDAADGARQLMHGIFVGEIQALEGAGRTCYDFEVGAGTGDVPFELKLDMARQCWDEARHCEISIKLGSHMGTYVGEFGEQVLLFEAACNADPVLRLTGVNRALEGLAIVVFNTMRIYGEGTDDPVLFFCEDWMLADEVTHVKMGSDWLRRITANDPERQKQALDFQRTVDKLFSFGGFRGEDDDSPVKLARHFRNLAGFTDDEITELVDVAAERPRRTVGLRRAPLAGVAHAGVVVVHRLR
jgi:uncharacterized ferritin-like protein (DUF455 family)